MKEIPPEQLQETAGEIPVVPPTPPPVPQAPMSSTPAAMVTPQAAAPSVPQQPVLKAGKAPTTILGTRTETRVSTSSLFITSVLFIRISKIDQLEN